MRDQSPMACALPLRTLRRNRLMLSISIGVVVPALAICGGMLLGNPRPAPLLVTVTEMTLPGTETRTTSVQVTPVHADVPAPVKTSMAQQRLPFPASLLKDLSKSVTPTSTTLQTIEIASKPAADPNLRWFNGRPIRPARTMKMNVTAYSPDSRSCGESADGITASGYSVFTNGMKMAAADTNVLPFGTLITVPGYDHESPVPVLDRGGAIKGHRLDMLYPTHEQARVWGVQDLTITVWEYADGQPNDFKTQYRVASR